MSSLQFGLIPCLLPGCVLVVKREEFPLVGAKVHYDLSDVQMLATLTQTYTSNATIDAEIRYVFPLPADASVCSFKAVIDGKRTINGVVKEKAKAKAEYDQAVSQGKTAALLEQDNVEIFQVSLGNIKPKQTIEVHISFVSVISHDGSLDSLRLTFPTVIAPRYGTPPSGVSGSFSLGHSKNALEFSVAVEMTSHIKSITSPSHPISMQLGGSTLESAEEFNPMKAHVSLSSPTLLEKDIVLVLSCEGLDKPRCMVESSSSDDDGQWYTDAYALTLVPRFELPPIPAQEYIFLVDRSGSMSGGKIAAVRSALQILLRSLPSRGTSFNIISFGSKHSSLWKRSVDYTAESVKKASKHVDSMTADFGGTEIQAAIQAAFASRISRPTDETKSTSVFVLTDGQAWDLDGVQSVIQNTFMKCKTEGLLVRTFCMGIGDAVSKAMCDAMARAGRGTAVFVGEKEKPDHKLMGLLRAARGPVVEDISIDWGVGNDSKSETDVQDFEMVSTQEGSPESPKDATPISLFDESSTMSSETVVLGPQTAKVKLPPPPRVQEAPSAKSLPPLYPGFRTSLFAIVRRGAGDAIPSKEVRVKGSVLGRPVVLEVPVSQVSKSPIEKHAHIKSIEDNGVANMSEVNKAEVLRLAERYGLASSQTSFIAVDEQEKLIDAIFSTASAEYSLGAWSENTLHGMIGGRLGSRSAGASSLLSAGIQYSPPGANIQYSPPRKRRSAAIIPSLVPMSKRRFGGGGPGGPKIHGDLFDLEADGGSSSQATSKEKEALPKKAATLFSQSFSSSRKSKKSANAPAPPSTITSSPTIETFARAQSFDGSFAGSPSLFQLVVQKSQAPAVPTALEAAGPRKETLWCTLLCIVYLESKFPEDKEVWTVLVDKATQFVEDTLQEIGEHDVVEKVRELKQDALKCII